MILEVIKPLLKTLEDRIERLENSINRKIPSKDQKTTFSFPEFQNRIKFHYNEINREERRGGMVPIPHLWDRLHKEGINRKDFEDGLFELERQRIIELQIASDPKIVREPDKAIYHPSRGMINYVIWRR